LNGVRLGFARRVGKPFPERGSTPCPGRSIAGSARSSARIESWLLPLRLGFTEFLSKVIAWEKLRPRNCRKCAKGFRCGMNRVPVPQRAIVSSAAYVFARRTSQTRTGIGVRASSAVPLELEAQELRQGPNGTRQLGATHFVFRPQAMCSPAYWAASVMLPVPRTPGRGRLVSPLGCSCMGVELYIMIVV
jgi:hypothetical protein